MAEKTQLSDSYGSINMSCIKKFRGGNVKKNDLLILSYLRRNARESLVNISKNTGIPVSTVYDRLNDYQNSFIKRHVSLIDFEKTGFAIRAAFIIDAIDASRLKEFVMASQSVNSAYVMGKDNIIFADCVFKDMAAMQEFSAKLDDFRFRTKDIHFITMELKREEFLSNPEPIAKQMMLEAKQKKE